MNKPASEPDEVPPYEPPPPDPNERPEGNNDTIHHPDPEAERHPVKPQYRREIGPYTTGNY
jgi:hypothetical protein